MCHVSRLALCGGARRPCWVASGCGTGRLQGEWLTVVEKKVQDVVHERAEQEPLATCVPDGREHPTLVQCHCRVFRPPCQPVPLPCARRSPLRHSRVTTTPSAPPPPPPATQAFGAVAHVWACRNPQTTKSTTPPPPRPQSPPLHTRRIPPSQLLPPWWRRSRRRRRPPRRRRRQQQRHPMRPVRQWYRYTPRCRPPWPPAWCRTPSRSLYGRWAWERVPWHATFPYVCQSVIQAPCLFATHPSYPIHTAPSRPQTSHGSLCAPVGRAALAAMSVTGAAALRAWRADVAAAALGTWHDTTRRLLYEYGGYVVGTAPQHTGSRTRSSRCPDTTQLQTVFLDYDARVLYKYRMRPCTAPACS